MRHRAPPPLFGALLESTGYRETFGLVGAVAVLAAVATLAIVVRYREEIAFGASASSGD